MYLFPARTTRTGRLHLRVNNPSRNLSRQARHCIETLRASYSRKSQRSQLILQVNCKHLNFRMTTLQRLNPADLRRKFAGGGSAAMRRGCMSKMWSEGFADLDDEGGEGSVQLKPGDRVRSAVIPVSQFDEFCKRLQDFVGHDEASPASHSRGTRIATVGVATIVLHHIYWISWEMGRNSTIGGALWLHRRCIPAQRWRCACGESSYTHRRSHQSAIHIAMSRRRRPRRPRDALHSAFPFV